MDVKTLNLKLSKIKMIVMDVDGTMTDGTVYYSKNGEEFKRFSIRDGMGIGLLRMNGIVSAIMTSEDSPIVTARANKLKIDHVVLGSRNKKKDLTELAVRTGLTLEEIAFIGDDVNDIQAMQASGFSACPNNSVLNVKEIADYLCTQNGGDGAVRELAELILISQNKQITLPENW